MPCYLAAFVRATVGLMFTVLLAFPVVGETASELEILPTKLTEITQVKLPGTVSDVKVGGDGRFLFLHLKGLRKIGMLDINTGEVVHYFPASDDDTVFDASISKLVIASGSKGVIARYDLLTRERELTQAIDVTSLDHLLIGSATEGPIYISGGEEGYRGKGKQVDMKTLTVSDFPLQKGASRGFGSKARIRLSANGKTFGLWATMVSPSGLQTIVKSGDAWKGFYEHNSVGNVLPSPDGQTIYTGNGIYSNKLQRKGKPSRSNNPLPSVHGNYYLNLVIAKKTSNVSVHLAGESRPLFGVPKLSFNFGDRGSREGLDIDKRLFMIPRANLIVHVPQTADKVVLHPLDLNKALEGSDIDYLFVQSRPPLEATVGKPFEYQLDVLSKAGKLGYRLDSGPEGMKVSESGQVSWQPSAESPPLNNIIITVSDGAGQEVFHSFTLQVPGGSGAADSQASSGGSAKEIDSTSQPIKPTALIEKTKTIKLPATVAAVAHGGAGRYMLLHFESLKKVGLFDIEELRITHYFPASDDSTEIAAGLNHVLIASPDQGIISRYNLKTFERELTQSIPFTGKIEYLAMGSASMGPAMMRVAKGSGQIDSCEFEFLDLKTLDRFSAEWPQRPHSVNRDHNFIRAATVGEKYTVDGVGPVAINGDKVELRYNHGTRGVIPSFDGSYYCGSNQIYNADMKPLGDGTNRNQRLMIVPAVMGNYYLSYQFEQSLGQRNREKKDTTAKLFIFGDDRPLVTLSDMETPTVGSNQYQNRGLPLDRRVMFVPEASVIVTLASTNDKLVLRRMDIGEALEESGIDYLVVMSSAPATVISGETYQYQLDVKSKKGGLKFRIESGPEGMTISPKGLVEWDIPESIDQADHKVIVSIADAAGQETFHTFSVEVPFLAEKKQEQRRIAAKEKAEAEEKKMAELRTQQAKAREIQRQRYLAQRKVLEREAEQNRERMDRERQSQSKKSTSGFEYRDWTDVSGKHAMRAKFVRIENKEFVLLLDEKAKEFKIPMLKLSSSDIYEAVENDLRRLKQIESTSEESSSPFEEIK